jgi:hypothetical protein
MASDELPKIEPTLTIEGAPSIAPSTSEMTEAAKADASPVPKAEPEVAAAAEPSLPPAPHLSAIEPALSAEPKPEARTEATITRMPALRSAQASERPAEPDVTVKPRVARFALLAACVAIAASFGAVGGSIGVARFGPLFTAAPPPVAAITKDNVADEVKSLKDTVAQLRTTTKSLSDNLSALKTSVNTSNSTQNTQIGKIAETLDRVEKTQAEQRKTAAAPAVNIAAAPETTGSIGQQKPVPMVLGEPPTNLKPPIVQGWVLRRVYDGAALIEGRDGIIEVETGSIAPGLGRIEGIKRQDGRWVVLTARGIVVGR